MQSSNRQSSISTTVPKTAVIGANGFLGRHLLQVYRAHYPDCLATTRDAEDETVCLDLCVPNIKPLRLDNSDYSHAIVAGAVTSVARCEQDKPGTRSCNVTGTLDLACQLTEIGIVPVFFSSDYVFDGVCGGYVDDAPTHPINEYGWQKAEVERRLMAICGGKALIVRLSKVFSVNSGDGTLLDEMASRLSHGITVRAAYDQIFCPTLVDDVVNAVIGLQQARATGIFNVCSPQVWTRLNLAIAMAEALGAKHTLVQKISLDDLGEPFQRPKRTNLICERLHTATNVEFTPIARSIKQVVATTKKKRAGNGNDDNL